MTPFTKAGRRLLDGYFYGRAEFAARIGDVEAEASTPITWYGTYNGVHAHIIATEWWMGKDGACPLCPRESEGSS